MMRYKVRFGASKTREYLTIFHIWFKMDYEMLNNMKIEELKKLLRLRGDAG